MGGIGECRLPAARHEPGMPHGYIRVRFVDYEGMATMPSSQRRAHGHRCRLEFCISHQAAVSVANCPFFSGSPPPTAAELCREWTSALADPTAVALLATADRRPVGSVLIRADRQACGELHAMHVLPEQGGKASGGALHDGAIDLLAGSGYDTAWLWVLAANDRARRMYEHRGWTSRTDTIRHYLGVQELRYSRLLR
jgi:GNAT superfamily N-acetyltransferase